MRPIPGPFDPIEQALFIDFDGVTHDADAGEVDFSGDAMTIKGERLFEWAEILAAALDGVEDVAVVVHSSWRAGLDDDALRALLPGSLGRLFAGATDRFLSRGESIQAWVADHGVRSHLILDDRPQDFEHAPPQLAICDPRRGASDPAILARVAAFLAAKPGHAHTPKASSRQP